MTTVLSVQNLSYSIQGHTILNRLSFKVQNGEKIALLGPNGAGKSTLLRILSGELTPNSGEVTLMGKPLKEYSSREMAQKRAVLSQNPSCHLDFAIEDIASLGFFPHKTPQNGSLQSRLVSQSLTQTGLSDLSQSSIHKVSGGEARRAHLARTLVQSLGDESRSPRLFMLDEPAANLDLKHQEELLKILRDTPAPDTSILAVLHDLNLALKFADRILILKNGELIQDAPPHSALTPTTIESVWEVFSEILKASDGQSHIAITGRIYA